MCFETCSFTTCSPNWCRPTASVPHEATDYVAWFFGTMFDFPVLVLCLRAVHFSRAGLSMKQHESIVPRGKVEGASTDQHYPWSVSHPLKPAADSCFSQLFWLTKSEEDHSSGNTLLPTVLLEVWGGGEAAAGHFFLPTWLRLQKQ